VPDRPAPQTLQLRHYVLAALVAGAIAVWPGACSRGRIPAGQGDEAGGAKATKAKLSYTLKDMSGKDVKLADYAGKPIILNFWATWCGPCKDEIPGLVAISRKYRDQGLTVLGVSIDDSPEDLQKFAAEYAMTYPVLVGFGHDDMLEEYEATFAVPVSWFIKPDGTVYLKHEGTQTREWFEQQALAILGL
jgi:thiol-disulfide isomerase/thioredoxin